MDEIWVEKYRPQKLTDVVGQDEVTSRLQSYVKTGNMPHLLFAGPAGTGKTTSSIALAREFYGDRWKERFLELNASDERGIDVVRDRIKKYAGTGDYVSGGAATSLGGKGQPPPQGPSYKIIFLDEADQLTADAQSALRRTMEKFSGTARFILSCNYSSRIIEPIQSRCAVFRFRPLKPEDITKMVRKIAGQEHVEVTKDGLEALLYVAQGDLRRAVNTLQVGASLGKKVDEDTIYRVTATARPEDVKAMLEAALRGEFLKAREALDTMLVTYGLSGEDVLKQVHRALFDLNVPDAIKVDLIDRVGEADFRLVEGASERIQIEALLAHFALAGGGLGAKKR